MKKIFILFFLIITYVLASNTKAYKIVYNEGTPPLKFTDVQGNPNGMLLDIWKLWAKKNNHKIEFIKTSWEDSLNMIKDGRADIHAGLYYTKNRDKFLDYSKKALYENKNYFFYEKETIKKIESKDDLKPFIVGIGNGYPVTFMKENYPEIITKYYPSNNDTINAIKNGEVKVFLNSLATFKYALKVNKIDVHSFKYLEDKPAFVKLYYGAVKEGNKKVLSLIDEGFEKLTDEEIKNIEIKWTDNFENINIEQNQAKYLTAEEKAWIKNNTVKVGGELDWPPFDFIDSKGKYQGISKDIIDLIATKTNLNFKYVVGQQWKNLVKDFKNNKLDILPALYKNEEREKYTIFSDPYFTIKDYAFIRKDEKNINSIDDLKTKRVAIIEGYSIEHDLKERFPNINLVKVRSKAQAIEAILLNKADVYIDGYAVVMHTLKTEFATNIKPAFAIDFYSNKLHIGINKNKKILASIIKKAINNITPDEKNQIINKWFFSEISKKENISIKLTKEEKKWIDKNKKVDIIKFFNEPPFTINKEKKEGYIYELLEYLTKSAGLKINYIEGYSTYDSMLQDLQKGKADILTSIPSDFKTVDNSNIKISKTILTTPFVIIGKMNHDEINNIDDLYGKRVAVVKGYAQDRYLSVFKKIKKVYVKNNDEGFDFIRSGKADFYINNRANSEYILNKSFTTDLHIVYEFPYDSFPPLAMSFAINGEKQILVSILQKALEQMPANEIKLIKDRWLTQYNETIKPIIFTKEEKAFIQKHPKIVLGADENWQPFDFRDRNGKHAGFDAEYLQLLREKLKIDIKVELGKWEVLQNKVKDKKLYGLVGPAKTKARDKYMVFTEPYFFLTQILLVRKDERNIKSLNDLTGKIVGFKSGSSDINYVKENFPHILQKVYDAHGDIIRAISIGEIDAGFTNIGAASYEMERNFISNLKVAFELENLTSDMRFGINKDYPQLAAILQKGIDSVTKEDINTILEKWLKLASIQDTKVKVNLTAKEREFIKNNSTIKVHNEKNWPPFNFFEFDQPRGYSIELMNLVAKNVGLNIEYITGPTWDQFLQMMKKDELDIMLNIVKSDEREKYLTFTDPFISAMHGIAIHKDTNDINSFQDLINNNKTIALERGFFYHGYLEKNFPNVKLKLVDNGAQTLTEVSYKKADATLGILPVMNYLADKNYITNLKFFGDSYENYFKPIDLRFATRKNQPILRSILQKGLASITPEEKKELSKRWLSDEEDETTKIDLTTEEKKWLNEHKEILFTGDPDWLPYEAFNESGEYVGIVSEHLQIFEDMLGIKFKLIQPKTWSEAVQMTQEGKVDVISEVVAKNTVHKSMDYTLPYIKTPLVTIIHKESNINSIVDLNRYKNKKIAYVKDYGYVEELKKLYPNISFYEMPTVKEGLEKLALKQIDIMIISLTTASYNINSMGLSDLDIVGKLPIEMKLGFGVRKDWQRLIQMLNRAIDSIDKKDQQNIMKHWVIEEDEKIDLTDKEQEWLDKNEALTYVYDVDWSPFEWKNELNEHTGIIFDILSLIEQKSGIKFEEIATNKWSDAVEIMKNKKAAMYSGIGENEEREEYLNFTKNTIFETPYVFVARENDKHDYLETFKVIQNKKVGVVDGYTIHGILKESKPNLPLITVKTVKEGFEKVRSGNIDIFIVNAATAKYYINRMGFDELKIATKTEFNLELKIALQKDLPDEVLSILDKSIAAISEKEKSDIYFKWTEVLVEEKIDWDLIYKIGGGALLLIILVSYWNRKLKNAVDEKTHELQNILKSFDKNVIASKTDQKGIITYASKAFCKISGYTEDELIGNTHSMVRHGDTPKEIFKDMWQTITKEKVWKGVIKNRKKDGSFYWVKVIISPEYDVKGNFTGYSAIREDITAQIEVENLSKNLENLVQERTKELNEQKLRFELTVAGSGDGLWEYDLEKNETWYSPRFKELLGYKDDEFSNTMKAWQDSVHPQDLEYALSSFKEHIKKDIPFDITYRIKTKSGEYIWIRSRAKSLRDESGWVTRTSGSIADITRLKEIQQEIEDKQKFLDTLLDSQEQIVITTDGFSLKSANKKFLDFFEIETIEEFTKDYDCICDRFEDEEGYLSKIINDEKWIDFVINHKQTHKAKILKNGEEYIFSVSAATMPIENGIIKSAVLTDITELENIRRNIEMILSNIMLPVLITAQKERKILYANEYASIQYETPIESLVGSSIDNVYTSNTQKDEILNHMQSKGYVENLEERYKTNTGKEFTGLLSVKPITYNGIESFIGMVVDITKQKEIEEEIRQINKHTKDSIEYASLIQHALIPDKDKFNNYFKDYFTFWEPKDIVGGDIYLFEELRNKDECLLMVIDCTGHGVPGAFVTMLVKAIERQIVADINKSNDKVNTANILSYFNVTMRKLLKQDLVDSVSNAGFDGGILYYNKKENIVKYSGALTTLYYFEDTELKKIKGDRESIGYKKSNPDFKFKEHTIDIKDSIKFYISTDGYIDQNGGEKGFSMGKTKFTNILKENYLKPFNEQKNIFMDKLKDYQQNHIRNDDITIIGFECEENKNQKTSVDLNNWSI